jgi:hypothetical protein
MQPLSKSPKPSPKVSVRSFDYLHFVIFTCCAQNPLPALQEEDREQHALLLMVYPTSSFSVRVPICWQWQFFGCP